MTPFYDEQLLYSSDPPVKLRSPSQQQFASDSPLEESGFEPSVPLLRKALLGVANRDIGTISGAT